MRAVRISRPGGPAALTFDDVPRPVAAAGQVVVRVAAFGINRADRLPRRGLDPAPPGVPAGIPGLELAGEVVAIGDGVSAGAVGDTVMGVVLR
jgi:NADPH:quinone reductase-like Zn-dependent oxidoreductase